jgi:hypothetical protein
LAVVLAVVLTVGSEGRDLDSASGRTAVVTVGGPSGPVIPPGFLGVSIEYPALTVYAGSDPRELNPVFVRLLRNLAPTGTGVVRIGGDSADTTWWRQPRRQRPPGVTFGLTARWLSVARALATAAHARLLMGLDLEANRPALAAAEARAIVRALGPRRLVAFEIGNEAARYRMFAWYHARSGRPVYARSLAYSPADFTREFSAVARLLPPGVPAAGPTFGGPNWMTQLGSFLDRAPRLGLVTYHRYPLNRCLTTPQSPAYPAVTTLLRASSSEGLAEALPHYVALARSDGLALRLDEMNSVACGGKHGVSDVFAAALWAVDALPAIARTGVSGVNVHTFPGAAYGLFSFRHLRRGWVASVTPEYYGLLMFTKAAPAGARLLAIRSSAPQRIRAWATQAADGAVRVVVINPDMHRGELVTVRVPRGAGTAALIRLLAPSATASSGVTLGGRSFGSRTRSGTLGSMTATAVRAVAPGRYIVRMPAASAALLTLR